MLSVQARRLKEDGNAAYAQKDFDLALKLYQDALDACDNQLDLPILLFNNMAAVHLQAGDPNACIDVCHHALITCRFSDASLDRKRPWLHRAKTWSRMAKAYLQLNDTHCAFHALQFALACDPSLSEPYDLLSRHAASLAPHLQHETRTQSVRVSLDHHHSQRLVSTATGAPLTSFSSLPDALVDSLDSHDPQLRCLLIDAAGSDHAVFAAAAHLSSWTSQHDTLSSVRLDLTTRHPWAAARMRALYALLHTPTPPCDIATIARAEWIDADLLHDFLEPVLTTLAKDDSLPWEQRIMLRQWLHMPEASCLARVRRLHESLDDSTTVPDTNQLPNPLAWHPIHFHPLLWHEQDSDALQTLQDILTAAKDATEQLDITLEWHIGRPVQVLTDLARQDASFHIIDCMDHVVSDNGIWNILLNVWPLCQPNALVRTVHPRHLHEADHVFTKLGFGAPKHAWKLQQLLGLSCTAQSSSKDTTTIKDGDHDHQPSTSTHLDLHPLALLWTTTTSSSSSSSSTQLLDGQTTRKTLVRVLKHIADEKPFPERANRITPILEGRVLPLNTVHTFVALLNHIESFGSVFVLPEWLGDIRSSFLDNDSAVMQLPFVRLLQYALHAALEPSSLDIHLYSAPMDLQGDSQLLEYDGGIGEPKLALFIVRNEDEILEEFRDNWGDPLWIMLECFESTDAQRIDDVWFFHGRVYFRAPTSLLQHDAFQDGHVLLWDVQRFFMMAHTRLTALEPID